MKADINKLAQDLEDSGARVDPDVVTGGIRRTREQLAQVEFETVSECRNAVVFMSADGRLLDVGIKSDAMDRLDSRQMARALTGALQDAQHVAAEGTQLFARKQAAETRS